MKEDYLQQIVGMDALCYAFKNSVIDAFFRDNRRNLKATVDLDSKYFCFTPAYQLHFKAIKRMVEISDIFGIKFLERFKQDLMERVHYLENPEHVIKRENFESHINVISMYFSEIKEELEKKVSLLNSDEMDRLNEAIHCFFEGCYYSAIAMSVSAIEFRLLSLMTYGNPEANLEKLTLGQLIKEYLDNKEKYRNVIPKKHEPLLNHCNIYRIFSVHPKREEINKPIASSILNMTFMFLLDKNLAEKVGII